VVIVGGLGPSRLISESLPAGLVLDVAAALRPQPAVSAARSKLAAL
jgi:hypothetical protein